MFGRTLIAGELGIEFFQIPLSTVGNYNNLRKVEVVGRVIYGNSRNDETTLPLMKDKPCGLVEGNFDH